MKLKVNQSVVCRLALSLALPGCLLGAQAAPNPKVAPAAVTSTNGVAPTEIPKSVFIIPATLKEGRNPFFPYAAQPLPVSDPVSGQAPEPVIATSLFTLNGITSPPRRTCMINNRTFEPGEVGEVKVSNGGKVLVRCIEIRDDSVIIEVKGKRVELRLRFGL